jgi:hypothetical protein
MKKIKIVFLIIFLISNTLFSQVSGFQGKKNVIAASLFLKSSFVMPNKNGKSGYLSFNDRYSITYERVITRNKSLQIHATSFETQFELGLSPLNYFYFTSTPSSQFQKMSCNAFGADYIIYAPSHLAPLGAYFSVGFDIINSTVDVDTALFNQYSQYNTFPLYTNTSFTTTIGAANFKSGVKQIFFNRLSVDFNFHLGLVFSNAWKSTSFDDDVEAYLKSKIGQRLWGHYLWGVNCAIGIVF